MTSRAEARGWSFRTMHIARTGEAMKLPHMSWSSRLVGRLNIVAAAWPHGHSEFEKPYLNFRHTPDQGFTGYEGASISSGSFNTAINASAEMSASQT